MPRNAIPATPGFRAALRALLLAAACAAASCASCAPFQSVGVASEPRGADIFLDGQLSGKTPARFNLSTLQDHKVFLKKEGYRPELVVIQTRHGVKGEVFLTPPDVFVKLQALDAGSLARPPATKGGASPGAESEAERQRRLQIELEKEKDKGTQAPDPNAPNAPR